MTYTEDTKTSLYIKGYTDSDYTGDKKEYKSTTDYIFFLVNGLISYSFKI
jgi:hypothetical protein